MVTFDILEPTSNLDESLDKLGRIVGPLYQESWDKTKSTTYGGAPFNLNINAFANMWFAKALKIFVAYDADRNPVGFLLGMTFRPLPYESSVFRVEDWYTKGDADIEKQLFEYVSQAVRFIGCDEFWVADGVDRVPAMPAAWKHQNTFPLRRYVKA